MKAIKLFCLSLLLAVCTSSFLYGQRRWTLDECIEYALKNNISVRQKEIAWKQQKGELNASRMNFLPSLSGTVSQSFNYGRSASPEDNSYTNLNTRYSDFALNLSVPLTENIRNAYVLSMQKLNLKATLADFRQAQNDVALQIISAGLQVLYQKDTYGIAQKQVELSEELYEKHKLLKEYGKVTSTRFLESKAQMIQDYSEMVQSRNDYRQALLEFTQLLDLPSPENFELLPPDFKSKENMLALTPDEIYLRALKIHPQVMAESNRLERYKKNVSLLKCAFYPQLSLNLGINTGYYNIAGMVSSSFGRQWKNNINKSILLTLSIPLFNKLSNVFQVRNAGLQVANQELVLKNGKRELYKQIQKVYYNAVGSREKYFSTIASARSVQELFEELKEKYSLGRIATYEYNEARTRWLKADIEQIQGKYTYELNCRILLYTWIILIEMT